MDDVFWKYADKLKEHGGRFNAPIVYLVGERSFTTIIHWFLDRSPKSVICTCVETESPDASLDETISV